MIAFADRMYGSRNGNYMWVSRGHYNGVILEIRLGIPYISIKYRPHDYSLGVRIYDWEDVEYSVVQKIVLPRLAHLINGPLSVRERNYKVFKLMETEWYDCARAAMEGQ